MTPIDTSRSLAQLGGSIGYGGAQEDGRKSGLVERCEALYATPLEEYTPGDLRVMIGQDIALPYLVPLALDVLSREPLVEGDYFPGDLLAAVLRSGASHPYESFWAARPALRERLGAIVSRLEAVPEEVESALEGFRRVWGP